MKKSTLVLLTLVPVAVGLVVNFTLRLPVIGSLLFFLLPLATTVFWFYLGGRYARIGWNVLCSLLIGNATGLLSLVVYVWQRVFFAGGKCESVPGGGVTDVFRGCAHLSFRKTCNVV